MGLYYVEETSAGSCEPTPISGGILGTPAPDGKSILREIPYYRQRIRLRPRLGAAPSAASFDRVLFADELRVVKAKETGGLHPQNRLFRIDPNH